MSLARELIDRLAEIGATVQPAGDNHLIVRAGARPVPAELVKRLRETKAQILAALASTKHIAPDRSDLPDADDAAWWRRHYLVRSINWKLSGARPQSRARGIAWGELLNDWHRRHGIRAPQWQCAGCRQPIGGLASLTLGDGNRVHVDELDCLLSFGERWHSKATAGLETLGLDPPPSFEFL